MVDRIIYGHAGPILVWCNHDAKYVPCWLGLIGRATFRPAQIYTQKVVADFGKMMVDFWDDLAKQRLPKC